MHPRTLELFIWQVGRWWERFKKNLTFEILTHYPLHNWVRKWKYTHMSLGKKGGRLSWRWTHNCAQARWGLGRGPTWNRVKEKIFKKQNGVCRATQLLGKRLPGLLNVGRYFHLNQNDKSFKTKSSSIFHNLHGCLSLYYYYYYLVWWAGGFLSELVGKGDCFLLMPSCSFLLLQDSTEDKDLWPQLIPDGVSEALSQPSLRLAPNQEGHGFGISRCGHF